MNELDRLFNTFFYGPQTTNYPPYNIFKDGNNFILEYGVAGFSKDELDIDYDGKSMTVTGKKEEKSHNYEIVHKGLSGKNFKHTIAVRGTYDVGDVYLNNGILTIHMLDKAERVKPQIKIGDIPTIQQELLTG